MKSKIESYLNQIARLNLLTPVDAIYDRIGMFLYKDLPGNIRQEIRISVERQISQTDGVYREDPYYIKLWVYGKDIIRLTGSAVNTRFEETVLDWDLGRDDLPDFVWVWLLREGIRQTVRAVGPELLMRVIQEDTTHDEYVLRLKKLI